MWNNNWIARLSFVCGLSLCASLPTLAFASIDGVDVANYIIIYEGGGTGNHLNINNFTAPFTGDIGVAGNGLFAMSGGGGTNSTINGVNFAAANTGQTTGSLDGSVTGGFNYSVANVQPTMNALNTLSANLGAQAALGTSIAINASGGTGQTIQAAAGANVGGNSLFNVTSLSTNNGIPLIIQGNGSQTVVFDINMAASISGNILLEDLSGKFLGQAGYNGLTPDQVLFNITGGTNLTGGNTLQINNQGDHSHPDNIIYADFLDPNGMISVVNSRVAGRVFGGDSHDLQVVSGDTITLPPGPVSPPPPTVPEPMGIAVWLGLSGMAAGAAAMRKKRQPASQRWSDQDRAAILAVVGGKARR